MLNENGQRQDPSGPFTTTPPSRPDPPPSRLLQRTWDPRLIYPVRRSVGSLRDRPTIPSAPWQAVEGGRVVGDVTRPPVPPPPSSDSGPTDGSFVATSSCPVSEIRDFLRNPPLLTRPRLHVYRGPRTEDPIVSHSVGLGPSGWVRETLGIRSTVPRLSRLGGPTSTAGGREYWVFSRLPVVGSP